MTEFGQAAYSSLLASYPISGHATRIPLRATSLQSRALFRTRLRVSRSIISFTIPHWALTRVTTRPSLSVSRNPMVRRVDQRAQNLGLSLGPPQRAASSSIVWALFRRGSVVAALVVAVAIAASNMYRSRGGDSPSTRHAGPVARKSELATVPVRRGLVVAEYPHDLDAFTQGLVWYDGGFIESTGLQGRSTIRRVEALTGRSEVLRRLPDADFGEGCTIAGDKLLQMVWKTGRGYVYALPELELVGELSFDGDGWGITVDRNDPALLYVSDGSAEIRVMRLVWTRSGMPPGEGDSTGHPDGKVMGRARLEEIRKFTVRNGDGGPSVALLNELQMIGDDELWANIWFSELVARIDVRTGLVREWVDLRGLLPVDAIPAGHKVDVLNGIAHDAETDRTFVTGKLWPRVFEIRASDEISAESIAYLNPFFTDPDQVAYIMSLTV
jgi:glutaminyl-peptide cyclotransferase